MVFFLLLLADAGGRLPGRHQPDYAAVAALRGQRLHLPLEGHRLLPAAVRRHQETVSSADCAYARLALGNFEPDPYVYCRFHGEQDI